VWTPHGAHIIFASDRYLDDRKRHNWDIYIMDPKGKSVRQLTFSGSFDSCPAISSDDTRLYFFSNRGAQKQGEESLQIFALPFQEH
jgi:Tol biopolymer transport system component